MFSFKMEDSSVQLGRQNPFGRIPVDQTIEETINKDTQTPRGTKGFSLKPAALSRYYLTAEYRSTCLKQLRELTDIKPPGASHHDLESTRIRKDELHVFSTFGPIIKKVRERAKYSSIKLLYLSQ